MTPSHITQTELTILQAAINIANEAGDRYDMAGRGADTPEAAMRHGRVAEALEGAKRALQSALIVHEVYGKPYAPPLEGAAEVTT